jgi:hypothetical protein
MSAARKLKKKGESGPAFEEPEEHATEITWTGVATLGNVCHLTERTQQLYLDLKKAFPINKVPENVVATFLELEGIVTEAEKKFEVLRLEAQQAFDNLEEEGTDAVR